jgi:exosortase/archaeosortase family protein
VKLNHVLQRLRSLDAASLWLGLACLLIGQSLLLSLLAGSPSQFVSLILAWFGAYLVCRVPLPIAREVMRPTLSGACLGFALLVWVQWRIHLIAGNDLAITFLPFFSVLGLLLVAVPRQGCKPFLASLGLLVLLPVMEFLNYSNSISQALIMLNAGILRVSLLLLGLPAKGEGALLTLYEGGVRIYPSCSGLDSVKQLIMVAIIFAIAFPMLYRWQNGWMCLVAVSLALALNVLRIGLLLLIDGSPIPNRDYWFELFHTGWPALLFPGVATYLFVQIYLLWMERQVAEVEG